jgi:hypothetical protein
MASFVWLVAALGWLGDVWPLSPFIISHSPGPLYNERCSLSLQWDDWSSLYENELSKAQNRNYQLLEG